uniref:Uncharacterized protein n=1 Tax=Vombatus ursinus TaxID=29139 RepID=A0A4X2M1W7_VOMUR
MERAVTPTEMANSLGRHAPNDRKWQIFKTYATKGTGLDEAMEWLVQTLKSWQQPHPAKVTSRIPSGAVQRAPHDHQTLMQFLAHTGLTETLVIPKIKFLFKGYLILIEPTECLFCII